MKEELGGEGGVGEERCRVRGRWPGARGGGEVGVCYCASGGGVWVSVGKCETGR